MYSSRKLTRVTPTILLSQISSEYSGDLFFCYERAYSEDAQRRTVVWATIRCALANAQTSQSTQKCCLRSTKIRCLSSRRKPGIAFDFKEYIF